MVNHSLSEEPCSRILRKIVSLVFLLWAVILSAEDHRYVEDGCNNAYWLYDSSHTATVVPLWNGDYRVKWAGHKEIPEFFTDNNITYTVTALNEMLFYENEDLTSVSLPHSIRRIDSLAFANTGLTAFYVSWSASELAAVTYPKTDTMSIFKDLNCGSINLYVPKNTVTAYSAKKPWNQFRIVEYDPTGLDNINAKAKAVKHIVNGQLFIERDGHIYNALGEQITQPNN